MSLETIYVTVGTTRFNELIAEITSDKVLRVLKDRGCRNLILQIGNGRPIDAQHIQRTYGIDVEQYTFKFETPRTDILKADLVIGHAGAGTCMDILNQNKRGLIVINERLMNNHQIELALQLAEDGYLYYCTTNQLAENLEVLDFNALKEYTRQTNMYKFVNFLNDLMTS